MTASGDGKVIVRVEVVIEGLGTPAKVTTSEAVHPMDAAAPMQALTERTVNKPLAIGLLSANVPVACVVAGQSCMEASGTSPLLGGVYAQVVKAMAYPTPNFPLPANPPANAATDMPAGNPNWSFTAAKGNAVPGGTFTPDWNGPVNSTLVVWYFYNDTGPSDAEPANFHGYQAGSGSTSASAIARGSAEPAVLHATFTGALASLRTVTLTWNGVSWAGDSSVAGGCVFSLFCRDETFQLTAAGPATAFLLAALCRRAQPFSWTAEGSAHGPLSGRFAVVIVE